MIQVYLARFPNADPAGLLVAVAPSSFDEQTGGHAIQTCAEALDAMAARGLPLFGRSMATSADAILSIPKHALSEYAAWIGRAEQDPNPMVQQAARRIEGQEPLPRDDLR